MDDIVFITSETSLTVCPPVTSDSKNLASNDEPKNTIEPQNTMSSNETSSTSVKLEENDVATSSKIVSILKT